jgi:AbiV family abortive infection protein
MTKKRLGQFRGNLDAAALAAGMNAANANARRLVIDARHLLEIGSFPSAAALAILAIEEAGKPSILRGLALAQDAKELKDAWRDYRSHTRKNVTWTLPQLVTDGARHLDDMRPLFEESSDHPEILDRLKQLAIYSDCLGEGHWSEPNQVVEEDLARRLVQTAHLMSQRREVTTQEMELWIKHMGPVWNRDPGWMRTALVNWHRELVAAGLSDDQDGSMARFVWGESVDATTKPSGE